MAEPHLLVKLVLPQLEIRLELAQVWVVFQHLKPATRSHRRPTLLHVHLSGGLVTKSLSKDVVIIDVLVCCSLILRYDVTRCLAHR